MFLAYVYLFYSRSPSPDDAGKSASASASEQDALASMLKAPSILSQAALLGGLASNPLYAVQLAQQLQAAQQLMAKSANAAAASGDGGGDDGGHRKRRHGSQGSETDDDNALNLSKKKLPRVESPLLDLSGPPQQPQRDPAAAALAGLAAAAAAKNSAAAEMATAAAAAKSSAASAGAAPGVNPAMFAAAGMMPGWPFMNPFLAANASPEAALMAAAAARYSQQQQATSPPSLPAASPTLRMSATRSPLDQMNEIAKNGRSASSHPPPQSSPGGRPAVGARHSAWQSQWINRGPENTRDIFKCVGCKESFPNLQALTTHMRDTGHYQQATSAATAMPPAGVPKSTPASSSPSPRSPAPTSPLLFPTGMKPVVGPPRPPLPHSAAIPTIAAATTPPSKLPPTSSSPNSSPPKRDILKEQLPLPRKLVRGQDVWLGKGEEQTKNILKCMYCGQSFRSLDSLTHHMQETKHYTKVISKEQISTWKSQSDEPPSSTPPMPPATASVPKAK